MEPLAAILGNEATFGGLLIEGIARTFNLGQQVDQVCTAITEAEAIEEGQRVFEQVTGALAVNRFIADRLGLALNEQRAPVVVLDAGLHRLEGPFRTNLTTIEDADGTSEQRVLPPFLSMHGEDVWSALVGGPLFNQITALFTPAEIVPYRIFDQFYFDADPMNPNNEIVGQYRADAQRFIDGLTMADTEPNALIVNVSATFASNLSTMRQFITSSGERFLIVAAAGNSGVAVEQVYPAAYGEVGNNVLTVASVDRFSMPTISTFSNRGATHVELAAWGCRVPVIRFNADGQAVRSFASGTSIAAPLASFAASMVLFERRANQAPLRPMQVERRLLYSADLDPTLFSSQAVVDGRVLNIAKAIAVYTDVVEIDGALRFGHLNFPASSSGRLQLCPDVRVAVADIRKIFNFGAIEPNQFIQATHLIYVEDANGALRTHWCPTLDRIDATFEDILAGTTAPLDFTQVRDVVFAERPYWGSR